jgi:hypothetical protein
MMREPLRFNTPIVGADGTPTEQFQRLWQLTLSSDGPVITLQSAQQPQTKGTLVVEATSDTLLTFRYMGSDGIVRSGTKTLT